MPPKSRGDWRGTRGRPGKKEKKREQERGSGSQAPTNIQMEKRTPGSGGRKILKMQLSKFQM